MHTRLGRGWCVRIEIMHIELPVLSDGVCNRYPVLVDVPLPSVPPESVPAHSRVVRFGAWTTTRALGVLSPAARAYLAPYLRHLRLGYREGLLGEAITLGSPGPCT